MSKRVVEITEDMLGYADYMDNNKLDLPSCVICRETAYKLGYETITFVHEEIMEWMRENKIKWQLRHPTTICNRYHLPYTGRPLRFVFSSSIDATKFKLRWL